MIGGGGKAARTLCLIGGLQLSVCSLVRKGRGSDCGLVDFAKGGMFMLKQMNLK